MDLRARKPRCIGQQIRHPARGDAVMLAVFQRRKVVCFGENRARAQGVDQAGAAQVVPGAHPIRPGTQGFVRIRPRRHRQWGRGHGGGDQRKRGRPAA
ncbi:hypothetical protein RZS08_25340, partial [Arthrospira platensis SPKY1]|nr:hypothetical protein [Arthrospira platensis SPKY1]